MDLECLAVNRLFELEAEHKELLEEFDALAEETKQAHDMLDKAGVGKSHWSLAGRIERLAVHGRGVDAGTAEPKK